jgi:hypothetical protein
MGGYLLQFGRDAALAMPPRVWEARGYATRVEMLSDTGGGRHRFEVQRLIEWRSSPPGTGKGGGGRGRPTTSAA